MIKRKLEEIAGGIYRNVFFFFKRIAIEVNTHSILKPGSYVKNSALEGRNYLGRGTVIRNVRLGFGSYINNNGDFSDTTIGKYTSIGANVSTVIGRHPLSKQAAMHPAFTNPNKIFGFSYAENKTFMDTLGHIEIGNDVWIGNNVLIMDGVKIGDGAVVGTGALVTKDLPPYSINAGIPAKTKRYRFSPDQAEALLKLKWWDRGERWIRSNIDSFKDADKLIEVMRSADAAAGRSSEKDK